MKEEFEKFYYNELGMCGCGNPDDLKKFLFRVLEIQTKKSDLKYEEKQELITSAFNECGLDTVLEFIYHVFDKHGLMEHGGYVGNGWVTPYGKHIMKLMFMSLNSDFILSEEDYINMGQINKDGELICFEV